MPNTEVTQILTFREVKIVRQIYQKKSIILEAVKTSEMEVCPKCAHPSWSTYDHRKVTVKDEPLGSRRVTVEFSKRRFWCARCKKPFTESIEGVRKGHRTTERMKKALLKACESYVSLKKVEAAFNVSSGYIFKIFYQQLELRRRMHNQYSWPSILGIDEHSFRRTKGHVEFATIFIDYKKSRVFELTDGKSEATVTKQVSEIQGRENVKSVVIDMCEAFKNFVENHFKNATITIDKFHVLRLISKPFSRCRREKVGHLKSHPRARLLFRSEDKLDHNFIREPGARTRTDVISPARGYYFYLNFRGTFCTRELPLDKKVGYSLDYSGLAVL